MVALRVWCFPPEPQRLWRDWKGRAGPCYTGCDPEGASGAWMPCPQLLLLSLRSSTVSSLLKTGCWVTAQAMTRRAQPQSGYTLSFRRLGSCHSRRRSQVCQEKIRENRPFPGDYFYSGLHLWQIFFFFSFGIRLLHLWSIPANEYLFWLSTWGVTLLLLIRNTYFRTVTVYPPLRTG